jgi:aspartyl-tRNA(Asn)/glutamyl-tRNA(Gln) amidotransferase subunit A
MSDIAFLSATELLKLYRERELSPVEVTEAVLRQIDLYNLRVNAYCLVDAEQALADARESEERYRTGEPRGGLDGVPASIKDVFLTRGWPTLRGSRIVDPNQEWYEDAPVAARLREHGAVLLGKTTTPEYGWKGVTDSPLTGFTGNPWDPTRTAGGSSGGSAAAVALGMGPLSVGTDGGGSVRIPVAFCGIVGLKPTYGRIPLWPASPFGTLAHAGPIARAVPDAALMLNVLAEPDVRDWTSLPPDDVDYLAALEGGVEGLRVAFSPDLGYVSVQSEVQEAVRAAVQAFEDMGANVEQTDPGFQDPVEVFHIHWYSGAANALRTYNEKMRELMDPGLIEIANQGAAYSVLEYLEAADRRSELGIHMGRFHAEYDLLLTPTVPISAFEAGREVPAGSPHRRWTNWTPFTYPFNLTQQPAASVPCGFTGDGLPIGLQIVGAKYCDALVLKAAHAYQSAHPLHGRRPSEIAEETGSGSKGG